MRTKKLRTGFCRCFDLIMRYLALGGAKEEYFYMPESPVP